MRRCLIWIGQRGRHFLIVGLAVGMFMPELAEVLRPWVGPLVAALLCVTGIRIGARDALGSLVDLPPALARIFVLQTALPLVAVLIFQLFGISAAPLALALCLMLAAPSVTGAPNFAIMMSGDPAPGMRLLVLGTALFPLTALPSLILLDPTGGGVQETGSLAGLLLLAILGAVGVGFALRHIAPRLGGAQAQSVLDGVAACLLAAVVVGLMSAVGPLLRSDPVALLLWLLVALAINFGLVTATLILSPSGRPALNTATAIYAGNRNIALFLIVLPDAIAAPLLVFVGCYQIPMYLTPALFGPARAVALRLRTVLGGSGAV